jgi:hypothetical protein
MVACAMSAAMLSSTNVATIWTMAPSVTGDKLTGLRFTPFESRDGNARPTAGRNLPIEP